MARPDIKEQRRKQILDAYEICVARYGLEGATLEKIAKTAGLARPLVRHNIGNREDLLEALVQRFLTQSRRSMEEMIEALPQTNRVETAVNWLFDPAYADSQLVQVSGALLAASQDNERLARQMADWLNDFTEPLTELLLASYPEADRQKVDAVAAGITGIYFNVEALYPLGMARVAPLIDASRRAALLLLQTLEERT
ncbi:TetR/AcrR family transcriptional regulator [Rhodovibrionaceae bacterium A322]